LHKSDTEALDYEHALQILAHVRDVAIVIARDGGLHYLNSAANRLLARKEPLRVRRGRLEAASAADAARLERAIDGACRRNPEEAEILVLRRSDAPPLVLCAYCLDTASGGTMLLLGSDGYVEPALVLGSLKRCFGLTQSEAQVAAAVAAGASSAAIAAERGVRVNTIRSQIKAIAAKLGCVTQSQISAIVRATSLSTDPK
jgi:DNA-binding CsgD family transcriptional regulator